MDTLVETVLTNAGFAGALLIVAGWALWKKDQQVVALQDAAVAREREHAEKLGSLAGEYSAKLGELADARTSDAQRVVGSLMDLQEKDAAATLSVTTTLVQVRNVLSEIRSDVRRRRSPSNQSIPPGGS